MRILYVCMHGVGSGSGWRSSAHISPPRQFQQQDICREYKTAIRLKAAIAEVPADDAKRQIELAAYFTHCALQPAHLLLALRMAMVAAFKVRARARARRCCC